MLTQAKSRLNEHELVRNLQKNVKLNYKVRSIVLIVWLILALLTMLPRYSGIEIFLLVASLVTHFFWSGQVIKFIFGYIQNKTIDLEIFFNTHREFWIKFVGGLLFSLPVYFITNAGGVTWLGLIASLIVANKFKKKLIEPLSIEYEAGTRPIPFWLLKQQYDEIRPVGDTGANFGGLLLPISEVNTHFNFVGTNGSGKTNLLRLYMQSVIPRCGQGKRDRAMIYDAKTEFVPILAGIGIAQSQIKILNPFDERACAWDMAEDLTRGRDAVALANILLPEKPNSGGSNEFFDKAARRILSGVTRLFMRYAPSVWTLRDVVLAAQSLELITALMMQDKQLRRNLAVLGSGDTIGNVMASIGAVIGDELETIAAHLDYHHQQGRTFTLKSWFLENYILLLGADRESEATLRPYNQLLFTRAAQLLTSPSDSRGNTFIILDELPALGKLEKIEEVARMGRSYGASLCIAFQAITDLENIYGEKLANSLIGQCDKAAYLRAKDRKTADWASSQIGNIKITWRSQTRGTSTSSGQLPFSGKLSQSESYSQQRDQDAVVRPEDIMNIAKPDKNANRGVFGYFRCDNHVFKNEISSAYLSENMMPTSDIVKQFVPIEEEIEDLRLWNEEDIERLGIEPFLIVFKEKDIKSLPFEDWVRFGEEVEIPNVDLD